MSKNDDNPPYITVVELFGVNHVNLMEWDARADSYQVSISKQYSDRAGAVIGAREWADREGYEVR